MRLKRSNTETPVPDLIRDLFQLSKEAPDQARGACCINDH